MKICPVCKTEYPGGEVFCPADAAKLTVPEGFAQGVATPAAPSDPLVGLTLSSRYKILRRIGEGGMGIVYEAEHVLIEKRVALKVLRDDFSSRPDVVERFRQEAKSASRIGHENIVDISDFGETPSGASYFVMEMLNGEDLSHVLAREGTLSVERTVKILSQCCRALGAAHGKGIVHRDMKPENIFLTRREETPDFVKIVDFGIAKMSDIETTGAPGRKLTKTGMIFGTPEYMSPEQAAGKALDHRVDIYAMGVILFELVSGRVPFVGDTFMGILTQHMFEPPPQIRAVNPNAKVSGELEAVIFKALEKDAARRFQSMEELLRAMTQAVDTASLGVQETLAGFQATSPTPVVRGPKVMAAEAASTAEFPPPKGSSRGLMIGLGLILAIAGLGGVGYAVFSGHNKTEASPPMAQPPATANVAVPVVADAGMALAIHTTPPALDAGPVVREVTIRVETQPIKEARIDVDGRMVCETTPCSFQTMSGTPIKLRARTRNGLVGQVDVTPDADRDFILPLARPRIVTKNEGHVPSLNDLKRVELP